MGDLRTMEGDVFSLSAYVCVFVERLPNCELRGRGGLGLIRRDVILVVALHLLPLCKLKLRF